MCSDSALFISNPSLPIVLFAYTFVLSKIDTIQTPNLCQRFFKAHSLKSKSFGFLG